MDHGALHHLPFLQCHVHYTVYRGTPVLLFYEIPYMGNAVNEPTNCKKKYKTNVYPRERKGIFMSLLPAPAINNIVSFHPDPTNNKPGRK